MDQPRVAVLDYGAGNLRSVEKALARAGADAVVTEDAAAADAADGLVVPGVGHFGQCAEQFRARGFDDLVRGWADARRPVLGICVGMQILFEASEEAPDVPGLGVLPGRVRRFAVDLPVPHMGWNTLRVVGDDPLLAGLAGEHVYFVHAYHAEPSSAGEVVAVCEYGGTFPAAVRAGSVAGTQFHPEKSAEAGVLLLRNFVAEAASAAGAAA